MRHVCDAELKFSPHHLDQQLFLPAISEGAIRFRKAEDIRADRAALRNQRLPMGHQLPVRPDQPELDRPLAIQPMQGVIALFMEHKHSAFRIPYCIAEDGEIVPTQVGDAGPAIIPAYD